jgi:hypothetical protein
MAASWIRVMAGPPALYSGHRPIDKPQEDERILILKPNKFYGKTETAAFTYIILEHRKDYINAKYLQKSM